jgi:glutamate synthase domain-containing protein 3
MYGSKGGEVYVLGSAAGRPLINSVGSPKVVINGTCLDYLAESFMAGDPLKGGGFVILNGLTINDEGEIVELEDPYPGSNLFSLSSGGAIYIRDPYNMLDENQLHGGKYVKLSIEDWKLIYPYLKKNEELFGITVDFLLTVKGERRNFDKVYKKVVPK